MRGGDRGRGRLRGARVGRRPPAPELVDRRAWARNALATLAEAARPSRRGSPPTSTCPGRSADSPGAAPARRSGPRRGSPPATPRSGCWASTTSLSSGPVARRGCCSWPRTSRRPGVGLDADRDLFLRWVALHETTHVIQFERVEWLTAAPARARREPDRGRGRGPRRGRPRRVSGAGWCATRASSSGRRCGASSRAPWPIPSAGAIFDRLQATMTVIEGHAEHVMDACAATARTRAGRAAPPPRRAPGVARRARRPDRAAARHRPEAAPVRARQGVLRPRRRPRPAPRRVRLMLALGRPTCRRSTSSTAAAWLRAWQPRSADARFDPLTRPVTGSGPWVQTSVRFDRVNILRSNELETTDPRG